MEPRNEIELALCPRTPVSLSFNASWLAMAGSCTERFIVWVLWLTCANHWADFVSSV